MTDWKPTPKQQALLEAAMEIGLNRNISTLCDSAGVSRDAFYRWIKTNAGFKAAWDDIWRFSIKKHLPGIVAAQIAKAQDGDTPAARLIAELSGELKQKVEQTGKDGAPLVPPKLNIHLHGPSSS